eukprot:10007759-Alexandrium_andersonii.AAC.1
MFSCGNDFSIEGKPIKTWSGCRCAIEAVAKGVIKKLKGDSPEDSIASSSASADLADELLAACTRDGPQRHADAPITAQTEVFEECSVALAAHLELNPHGLPQAMHTCVAIINTRVWSLLAAYKRDSSEALTARGLVQKIGDGLWEKLGPFHKIFFPLATMDAAAVLPKAVKDIFGDKEAI